MIRPPPQVESLKLQNHAKFFKNKAKAEFLIFHISYAKRTANRGKGVPVRERPFRVANNSESST